MLEKLLESGRRPGARRGRADAANLIGARLLGAQRRVRRRRVVDSVLAIGCHADDIEIGCGGTIVALLERNPQLEITWVVLSADGRARRRGAGKLDCFPGRRRARAADHPRVVPRQLLPVRRRRDQRAFERLKQEVSRPARAHACGHRPPSGPSAGQRADLEHVPDHLILEFEIPKYEVTSARRTSSSRWTSRFATRSPSCSSTSAPSDRGTGSPRTCSWALMRLRGIEANSPTGYAEAFRCRKLQLTP